MAKANHILGDIRNNLVRDVMSESDGIINLRDTNVNMKQSLHRFKFKSSIKYFNGAKEFNIPAVHITVGNY